MNSIELCSPSSSRVSSDFFYDKKSSLINSFRAHFYGTHEKAVYTHNALYVCTLYIHTSQLLHVSVQVSAIVGRMCHNDIRNLFGVRYAQS